jgi:hypothetical protein
MIMHRSLLVVGLVLSLLAVTPTLALECPVPAQFDDPATAQAVRNILPQGIDLEAPNAVESAVFELGQAGVSEDFILDNLIASYCSSIAADPAIPEADKAQRVQGFSARVEPLVFAGDN